jgi:hypothetical protein
LCFKGGFVSKLIDSVGAVAPSWSWALLIVAVAGVVLWAIARNKSIKIGKFLEIGGGQANQIARHKWDLVVLSGFHNYMRAINPVLLRFLGGEVHSYCRGTFEAILKEKGGDLRNIQHHPDFIRFETLFQVVVRAVLLPRLFVVCFRNHLPVRAHLQDGTATEKATAARWYKEKTDILINDFCTHFALNWAIDAVTYEEYMAACPERDKVLAGVAAVMFEEVRTKRAGIFADLKEKIKDIDTKAVQTRWEDLYIISGFNDILKG